MAIRAWNITETKCISLVAITQSVGVVG